ncbi:hypothetical protein QQ008_07745 [Fulvivirgaceae bacterium BMA10]|uniref:Uncharacterized protein n=1 Tax=Splendidivirga corallicola TaxID=3051826 RepID=A0ABT8KKL6_9BACT|nr:hypothetical protein [Fulvivirgaceae bacterium BMA10]
MSGYQSDTNGSSDPIEGRVVIKGQIDASLFPPFPAAKKGDMFAVSKNGLIGDSDAGQGLIVNAGDSIYAISDNNGGAYAEIQDKWGCNSGKIQLGP